MSKKNENPYEVEQAVLDIDSKLLETASEKEIKEQIEKLKETYSQKRTERLEAQKGFIVAYKNTRNLSVDLLSKVKSGKMSPKNAIAYLRDFVKSDKLTTEQN